MLTLNRDAALEMKQERRIGCWSPKDSDLTRQRRTVVKGRLGSRLPPSPFLFFFTFSSRFRIGKRSLRWRTEMTSIAQAGRRREGLASTSDATRSYSEGVGALLVGGRKIRCCITTRTRLLHVSTIALVRDDQLLIFPNFVSRAFAIFPKVFFFF